VVEKLPADAFDPTVIQQTNDPKVMQGFQAALGALADLHRNDFTYTYMVQPDRTGNVTIPGFAVTSGNQTATTQPITLTVSDPTPQNWVKVNVSLANPSPIPGEETQLHIAVLVQRGLVKYGGKNSPHLPWKNVHLCIPMLENGPLEYARPLAKLLEEKACKPGENGYRVNHFTTSIALDHEPNDPNGEPLDPNY